MFQKSTFPNSSTFYDHLVHLCSLPLFREDDVSNDYYISSGTMNATADLQHNSLPPQGIDTFIHSARKSSFWTEYFFPISVSLFGVLMQ